jgi:hypothetical protein
MKLIETNREYAIECDNTNCLYRIKNTGQCTKQYIDEQCPSCGENLLTLQDYLDDEKLLKLINWVNKYFSWLRIFYSKQGWENERERFKVKCHKGIKIEK